MAKFRTQHSRGSKGGVFSGRLIMVFIIMAGLVAGAFLIAKSNLSQLKTSSDILNYNLPKDRYFIPTTKNGTLVHHKHYSLSYDESAEQSEWVAYFLTKSSLQAKNVPRAKRFNRDPLVPTESASHGDYIRSGYDRGHLVPAADMAFSQTAMNETFYMSNISPQLRQFNGAVWRELEESVRDWAYKYEALYVISGPIYGDSQKTIGNAKVRVPEAYFKVLLDLESKEKKAIAFRLDNKVSYLPLTDYMITIDELEDQTGFDFYGNLLEDDIENRLESEIDPSDWPLSKKRFDLRNTKWNKVK